MLDNAIETQRALLRPIVAGDAKALHAAMTWGVVRQLSRVPWPLPLAGVEDFASRAEAQTRAGISWHHTVVVDGTPAGVMSIRPRHGAMNLGYWLAEPHWGKGLATETAAAYVAGFFAGSSDVHLTSGAFSDNEASLRVQEKLGFVVVGEGLLESQALGRHRAHSDTMLGRTRWRESAMAA
ncbi:MAG: GNAT family N-acetyltransferase [Chelatococcus sp.]|jgi:RimJ/RimL family protein N-acetyltransferase|uniref:GNAT family N-acetyltransferase n=1 Tax=unclassified Chelatococcus TaxID=2638111 RepID=UPI001BCB78EC|nr:MULTISPECIES: GNAT family N-acetyltransferase [unclassified Chelatococcus]CAH1658259.1 RimJ/RimL family protein N-acetyltransferase [Hyphomicrobiales bacterium]MBS7740784.1 GNAT family N-acetyltransferase [Chelatococcus sp. HY11]MBX3537042.1 GNAT family N-acetyltransferase [Chelatococcus sp.]MBX3545982.1 GNAT family N-acetyltransferase [Chelatococcus sp.]MCO5079609.1 GNAT family N-acetyltransferase [Chelatococcus sp.]